MPFFTKLYNIWLARRQPSTLTGICLSLVSGIFYATLGAIVKMMQNIHPAQLTAYRFVAAGLFSLPEAVFYQKNLFGEKHLRLLLIYQGIASAFGSFLTFVAFQNLPLGEASVIIFSLPVIVTIAARIFLKEPIGVVQSISVVLSFVGILFTAQLPGRLSGKERVHTMSEIYGLLAALASLVCLTSSHLVVRKLTSIHHSIIMINVGWTSFLFMVVLTPLVGEFRLHYCGNQQLYLIALAVVSYFGAVFFTKALQCEHAGPVVAVRAASEVILAFLWQIFFFRQETNIFGIIGAFLISTSVIFIILRKYVLSLQADSKIFQYMKWITL